MNAPKSAFSAVAWSLVEKFSTQIVGLGIGIVLARLLSPGDYGTIGMMGLFLAIADTFVDSGFGNALIRKLDRTDADLSTAFYFNAGVGAFFALLLALISPLIARFFNEPVLVPLVCIAGFNLFLGSLCIVQKALLDARLDIRTQTFISLGAQIPAGTTAILLAYNGFGVYSLIIQGTTSALIRTATLWTITQWRPHSKFNGQSFKYLWSFGSKLLAATLVGTTFDNIYSFVIGKFFSKADLGYFSKASGLSANVNGVTSGIVMRSALPILSRYQKDLDVLRDKFRETMSLMVMLVAPLSAYLFFAGRDVVVFLWSDKWLGAVTLFQLLLVSVMFSPISNLSLSLFQVMGRTDITLKIEFPKKGIYLVLLAIGLCFGVVGLAAACIGINFVGAVINMFPTRKLLGYSYLKQALDVGKYMMIAYLVAYGVHYVMCFSLPIANIIVFFWVFFPAYAISLWLLRDACMLKYTHRAFTEIVSRLPWRSK